MRCTFARTFAQRAMHSIGLGVILGTLATSAIGGVANPPDGAPAPRIILDDINGKTVDSETLKGRAGVIVFGELNHEGTKKACGELQTVLADPRLAHGQAIPMLIIAQDAAPEVLREEASKGRYPALILHDPARDVFGEYEILVIPSVVVVDREGIVVHAMPGFSPRFKDLLSSSLLRATGQISQEQLDQVLHPETAPPIDPDVARANRLSSLGDELVRHGLIELAEDRYKEALEVAPGNERAMLGLGRLLIDQGRIEEAEAMYRSLRTKHPESTAAQLGLAEVGIRTGGESMDEAASTLRILLERNPNQPRALYLLGLVHEKREEWAEAASKYRAAAEMLLKSQ